MDSMSVRQENDQPILFFSDSLQKLERAKTDLNNVASFLAEVEGILHRENDLTRSERKALNKQLNFLQDVLRIVKGNFSTANKLITELKRIRR